MLVFILFIFLYQYYIILEKNKQIDKLKISINKTKLEITEIQKEQSQLDSEIENLKQDYEKIKKKRFLTQDDIKVLERIVEAEAGNQKLHGRILVASVVLNRLVERNRKTVRDVVFKQGQFSPISDGSYYNVIITDKTRKAVELAIEKDYSRGSLYFLNPKVASRGNLSWFNNNLMPTITAGDHVFYKE